MPLAAASANGTEFDAAKTLAQDILQATGVQGGLVIHVGCGAGQLTAALHANEGFLVQGLDVQAGKVAAAREFIRAAGLYGPVSVDEFDGRHLPYIDNLANLIVAHSPSGVSRAEILRVLCPEGVAYLRQEGGGWRKIVKPRPDAIDEWTHYLHDPSNNAVAQDTVVAPPDRLQWVGYPKFTRHHDRMSGISAVVSAGGRVFYITDEGLRMSILTPPHWKLVARDAFNGTVLWKRDIAHWHTHLWPLKSGPAQLPRRLVAIGDRVYVTLNLAGPVTAIDAATGETVRTYEATRGTEEILALDGVLFLLVNPHAQPPEYANLPRINQAYRGKFWDEKARSIMAVRAESGQMLWQAQHTVLPGTLAADARCVYFHDGQRVVCLDRQTGEENWRSAPIARAKIIESFYLPTLLVQQDVVLFSGGETAGVQTGSWYTKGKDTLTALSAETGKVLWSAYHPPSGYRSPEDVLVLKDLVWTGETTSGRAKGMFTGRDLHTGEVVSEFGPQLSTYWFHHRCYRGKATCNYLLMARAGTEFIDVQKEQWIPNHWFRGSCGYGVMPANGLMYAPPHPCACYLESKLSSFNALAPATLEPRIPPSLARQPRLEKGPAFSPSLNPQSAIRNPATDWPTYRHDAARSGCAGAPVPAAVQPTWSTPVAGKLTSPVIAGGQLLVASVNAHTVFALDIKTGGVRWHFTAGGRVDSPPTVYQGRVLFGSADGWIYCLRATDGVLIWRFRAAPMEQRLVAYDQVESVWPVPGNVLVQDGVAYAVAGRSMFLDDGLRLCRLRPETGELLSETVLGHDDPASNKDLQDYVQWLNMPVALPDVLSSDGHLVYMRSQPFHLDGTRLPLKAFPRMPDADAGAPPATQHPEHAHLFSPIGFVDDSWWHRSYWLYGSTFVSGWCGYYLAGKTAPAGRILVFDQDTVYGYGRKPQYFRWTTPMECQLFAAPKTFTASDEASDQKPKVSLVRVKKSPSLKLSGQPLTVSAWVKAEKPGGVVLARGGASYGYALYLQKGQPNFAVRVKESLAVVRAKQKVTGAWVHLAGVLTADKQLRLYVGGNLAASASVENLLITDPAEAMQIGADEGSTVGDYSGSFNFKGLIDEVRVYHRALRAAELQQLAAGQTSAARAESQLALHYTFDQGAANDASGHDNNGTVEGASAVAGKFGGALKFTGAGATVRGYLVPQTWTTDLPILARAMVKAGDTLFVAGPPDLIDEPEAFRRIDDPAMLARVKEQEAAFDGAQGALLLAIQADTGNELSRLELADVPVFDGLAAAGGKLYLTTAAGRVMCFAGRQ